MPLYHFDLRDGEAFVSDDEGGELPNVESAQVEAAQSVAELVKEAALHAPEPTGRFMSIEVRNSTGQCLCSASRFSTPRTSENDHEPRRRVQHLRIGGWGVAAHGARVCCVHLIGIQATPLRNHTRGHVVAWACLLSVAT